MDNQVFISYAREDKDLAMKLYSDLKSNGINAWIDLVDLKIGSWKTQIEKTISRSKYFIICLSQNAIKKTGVEPGFQDEELHFAYCIAQKQAISEFVIIPVRLEECGRGDHRTATYQQFDIFEDWELVLHKLVSQILGEATNDNIGSSAQSRIEGLMGRVITSYYAGAYYESKKIIDSLIVVFGKSKETLIWKGLIEIKEDHFEESILTNKDVLIMFPNDVKALNNIGVAYFNLGKHEEALIYFDKVLAIDSQRPLAWYNRGFTLVHLGRFEKVLECYYKLKALNPSMTVRDSDWAKFQQMIVDAQEKSIENLGQLAKGGKTGRSLKN